MNGCGMCNMHGCHSWVLRAILMIVILGIVFSCGVVTGELKSAVRSMHGYGYSRGGWDSDRMPMMKGYQIDTQNPDTVLYQ